MTRSTGLQAAVVFSCERWAALALETDLAAWNAAVAAGVIS